jgi:hypothetical protein
MDVDKNSWQIINQALKDWEEEREITPEQADRLRKSVNLRRSERQQVAQYFFFIALFCTLLAFGAIFLNEKFLEKLKIYFSLSDMVISLMSAALAVIWFWYTGKKRARLNPAAYEIYMVLGGLASLTAIIYACKELNAAATYIAFLSAAFLVLAALSVLMRSQALWIGAILAFIGWFGLFTTENAPDNLFLGMNYPMMYTALGALILIFALLQRRISKLRFTFSITYTIGLLLFFTGLWAVSIFGNYNTLAAWHQVRQIHVLAYSVVFGIAAALSFYLGIRYKDDIARDLGIMFLLVNLYTRYFEYFWDTMNKGIFFLVLAVTFGFLGWWLDRARTSRNKSRDNSTTKPSSPQSP